MEKRIVRPSWMDTMRLVKSEDLNHHGTLFAGRSAEWFVESGFVSAAALLDPKKLVCLKIHGMNFLKPVKPGQIIKFSSKIVHAGRTSLVAYIKVTTGIENIPVVNGFITFIYVDEETESLPHGIIIEPVTEEDHALNEEAAILKRK